MKAGDLEPAPQMTSDEVGSPLKDHPEITVLRDVMVTMRDGIRLATDIYLPRRRASGERFPVILERTPYDKLAPSRSELRVGAGAPMSRETVAAYFVRHGYALIYQDCRGRHRSEGVFAKYVDEGPDGYDACAWIVGQPWSDGRIGTMGLSYAAHTQSALASLGAPGVMAMFLDSGGFSNAYQGGIRQGGAFELKQVTWAMRAAADSPALQNDARALAELESVDLADWMLRIHEWRPGHSPLSAAPEFERYLFDQWQHGNFDEYWRRPGLYAQGFYDRFPDAAMVHMSSWYDVYSRTATENFVGLRKVARQAPVRLILGPWTHGNRSTTWSGDVDFGPTATLEHNIAPSFLALRLAWFDRHLKQVAAGKADEAPVQLFVMGGGSGRRNSDGRMEHGGNWRAEQDWPLARTRWTSFHLRANGSLTTATPDEASASRDWRHDPEAPVPTVGGAITSGEPIMSGGAFDQRETPGLFGASAPFLPLASRPDVQVFETAPLDQDVEITGPVSAEFWVASDCPDTDFHIKLIDCYPPNEDYPEGFAMNLTHGVLRARYRDSWESPTPLEPGAVYRIRIEAFPTSNVFKKGHRIRLDVASSNFPHFDVNSNTGEAEGRPHERRIAVNRVFLDEERPSRVILPVIPRDESQESL
jgi:uncharacterized protein